MITLKQGDIVNFEYRNWQGEVSQRKVIVRALEYGSNPYHPEAQWYMRGFCLDRQAERSFALRDIETDMLTKV